ncbi:hypothetical protein PT974_00662 [Cladobotryum mycophilum]|uniref:F-box domain-containing protein n=1 Tax=Cladobotryum mycophilum TaxID=491253 RepID=A0ABR0T1I2_9HYPO
MTLEPTKTPEVPQFDDDFDSSHSSQYGSLPRDPSGLYRIHSGDSSGSSERSGRSARRDSVGGVDADSLDERLRGLRLRDLGGGYAATPGQRISEYENALTPQTPKQGPGFQVTKGEPHEGGIQLNDFPNEILTHIFSHLPPDCHSSIALVSKRFWALVTTHHAWRMAFMRYFPGHTALESRVRSAEAGQQWNESEPDVVRSETRYFPRLTPLATWRSEYLLRTRHLRSLARGKPGLPPGVGSSGGAGRSGKKLSAVLTYNSKLPWQVTSIHAVFSNGKKPPRVIQGTGDLGAATISDPTTGKTEKWGIEDLFSAAQLEGVMTGLVPYGLGEGPAAVPNMVDVSQSYGMVVGEGFPGGRPYFRGVNEPRGRYLDAETGVADTNIDIPRIPEMMDAICSVWIAKSSSVTSTTQSMCGMLSGSALGVVTAYSLGWDTTGPRYANGDITARWVLSPGVPIISLKVDDNYSQKRKSSRRIWAVALNALGEVYYLTEAPTGRPVRANGEEAVKNAWHAGRTAYWYLLEATRRVAREDDVGNDTVSEAYSPRSSSNNLGLGQDQFVAEAREIERFLRYKPAHFRKVCEGWDMQRRLEVDFASDDAKGAGESIFVIDCGLSEHRPACVRRYVRSLISQQPIPADVPLPITAPPTPSLFGVVEGVAIQTTQAAESQSPRSPPPTPKSPPPSLMSLYDWSCQTLNIKDHEDSVISAVALDNSTTSLLTLAEDALHTANEGMVGANPWAGQAAREVPGRRARFILVGTNDGAVIVWNARDENQMDPISPIRVIQTESPEISCVAASGLYLVHGGSDGLVQAWDPLSSNMDAVRTINAKSNGRAPRHMLAMNPTLLEANYSAVGAIFLDPDPTVLQGVVSFGALLRYWSYSSSSHLTGRKKRARHSEMDSRLASRRQGGAVTGYIAAEEAELRRETEQRARERTRLLKRFGALGDLSEEEAILYAQMVSEEAYLVEEQRRASDSAPDASLDTASSFSENTVETWTPDPSVARPSASEVNGGSGNEDEYEQQIQQAIRLSLMESVSEPPQSSQGASPGDVGFTIKYKSKGGKKGKQSAAGSPSNSYTSVSGSAHPTTTTEDEDLALALSLSMQDQGGYSPSDVDSGARHGGFPSLPGNGAGKGKGVQRW